MTNDNRDRILDAIDELREDLNAFKVDLSRKIAELEGSATINTDFRKDFTKIIMGIMIMCLTAIGAAVLNITGIVNLHK